VNKKEKKKKKVGYFLKRDKMGITEIDSFSFPIRRP
jgi:hypothetical protein